MSTENEALMAQPTPWHLQPTPIPSWLMVVAIAFFGPGEMMVASAWPSDNYAVLADQVEELADRVDALAEQVEDLQSTDSQVAHVLAEVVRALDERGGTE